MDADITPDTKGWTWVLEENCPECGYDARTVDVEVVGTSFRDNSAAWARVLSGPALAQRPRPGTWSALEYACHVRDVHLLFVQRLAGMLNAGQEAYSFDNWDQDASAVAGDYARQDPAVVVRELIDAARTAAVAYDRVRGDAWRRVGLRSNGDRFTVDSFARYHLHDVVHHLWDVGGATVENVR